MQHVLLLSPFFYPEPISTGRYNLTMAEGLRDAGVRLTVACCHPFYPAWRVEASSAQLSGMSIIRGGRWLRFPASALLRRAVLESWFAIFATWQAWRLRREVDVVVAVFPPSLFFLGVSAVLPRRVRRVGVIHDLQGIHAEASRSPLTRALVGLIAAVERCAFGACDRLVVLSSAMGKKLTESTGIDAARITVVYPFVNLPPVALGADRLAALFHADKVHLVYSGALGEKQNPAQLAAIFEAISAALPEVVIHVFSNGPSFDWLKAQLTIRSVQRVSFQGLVADEDVAELYARADIQLIPQAAGTQHGSMPSKLPNILASGKRVLAICDADSEMVELIAQFKAGVCIDSWQPADVVAALRALLQDLHDGRTPVEADTIRKVFSLDRLVGAIRGV
ncbi:MAG: glycosyltransferase family 4 protein [Pseudomonadota bacterium]